MREFTSFILIFCLLSGVLEAQKISYSLLAGPNMNTHRGNKILEKLHHPFYSYSISGNISYHLQTNFCISTGLAYERKGTKSISDSLYDNDANYMGSGKTNHILNYLVLPLNAEYRSGQKIIFYAGAGVYAGLLLNSKEKYTLHLVNGSNYEGTSHTGLYKSFDLGLNLKTGLTIPLRKHYNLQIEVKDDLGLMNISSVPVIDNGSIKTNSLNLLAGISFKI
jgi:hypothetical protein